MRCSSALYLAIVSELEFPTFFCVVCPLPLPKMSLSTMRASVRRLEQTLSHVRPDPRPSTLQLSLVEGPTQPELLDITLGELLTFQRLQYGDHECLVFPWTDTRWTYAELSEESSQLARGLLALGVHKGDRIGIMAGNCEQYISLFFAAARVGAILVVLNNTYTASEVYYALNHTGLSTSMSFFETAQTLIS